MKLLAELNGSGSGNARKEVGDLVFAAVISRNGVDTTWPN